MSNNLPAKPNVDIRAMQQCRLEKIQAALHHNDIALAVLANPVSLRYAADIREYPTFQSRIPLIYLFVPVSGDVIAYGSNNRSSPVLDQLKETIHLNVFEGGFDFSRHIGKLVSEIKNHLHNIGADNNRVCIEQLNPSIALQLQQAGLEVFDAEIIMEQARLIKSSEEITCLRHSIAVCEYGIAEMHKALQPGMTENELLSHLYRINIAGDGDWIEGRMLCSGARTFPWFQESSEKVIVAGDLVAFDTDMIGPFGYCADISRTFFCQPGTPSPEQKHYYRLAWEEIEHNIDLLKPGMGFREFSDKAYRQSDDIAKNQYVCVAHGIGMCDEYPKIYYRQDWDAAGYDGEFQPNTTLCIESYVGASVHGFGVKLEESVLITETGVERLSSYPFEYDLLE